MQKILIIRNDKLGDFMLALPSFALVKQNLPGCEVHALVPEYTKDIAQCCSWIDKIIIDPGQNARISKNISLLKQLSNENYDAVITLFSTTRIGLITKLAGIPYRLAPATKLAQVFYNHRLTQKRSRSEKPEYAYNMDLVSHFLEYNHISDIQEADTPYLAFPEKEIITLKDEFVRNNQIPPDHKLIFIHPGSGGSASNLTPSQFAELANLLESTSGHTIVITAGPGEIAPAKIVANNLSKSPHMIFESNTGLVDFSRHLQFADLFISGSTGPLHIAGALDTPTAGFYPRRQSATPLRWQTLNSPYNRLAFSPDESVAQEDMSAINLAAAADIISKNFLT